MDQSEKSITLITRKSRNRFDVLTPQSEISSLIFDYNNHVDELFGISTRNKEKVKLICISY